MIEVLAKLVRGPVYLSGDTIECYITFSNPPAALHKRSQSNSDVLESLAWATAQIHCQCTTNSKVSIPTDKSSMNSVEERIATSADTSFVPFRGENGHVVVTTNPKILFCDLRLSSGESKTYSYSEILPHEAPPSYRGHAVKYSYKITIGMQRVNCPIKLLRVPFRVLPLLTNGPANAFPDPGLCDSEDLTPSNPFLEAQRKESTHELTLQLLQNISARRTTNFYNITNKRGRVARFCLFKHNYKLGEDIVGVLDFTGSNVTCVQLSVILQSEEEVAPDHRRWAKQAATIVSYSKHHELCLSLRHSHLTMPVPLHVTPAFNTDLVNLKWRLHFEFVTSTLPSLSSFELEETWQGPASLDIETMVWNLPINVYATTPVFVAQGIQGQSKFSLII